MATDLQSETRTAAKASLGRDLGKIEMRQKRSRIGVAVLQHPPHEALLIVR
jgi:hypothetical protein